MQEVNRRVTGLNAIFLFALFATHLVRAEEAPPKELKIVFIAYQNPDQLLEDVRPVVGYLNQQLNIRIKHFVATDYAGVVEALRNKTADMGFMGPLQYIMAHDQAGAFPILGEVYKGKPFYVSRIFVHKDSGVKRLEDLRGKTIAFVDPISSSGYMYPLDIFKHAGLLQDKGEAEKFFKRIYFAGGDEQAIRAVLNKFVDAAGVGQYSYSLLRPEERDEVIHIAESQPIPSHCVVVRKDLNPQTVAKLQAALLVLNKGSNRQLLKYLYNVDGYVKVAHADYESVERVAREYGFLKGK
ncbi:phosphate/phosphite/phosphonate ABC transporter substrate-binding protein [Acidobacteria bacterium AH-259-A15]|nr:phosphate/phosphite/phosphonate ABC transporter substrate-binding protein [Acidobacteria bacterium AH-259-A15]